MTRWPKPILLLIFGLPLAGCSGIQSVVAPEGSQAASIALLFWVLTGGSAVILAGVMILTGFALAGRRRAPQWLASEAIVVGGGLVFPVVVLTVLLGYGLYVMRGGSLPIAEDGVRIAVVGERWWWRVVYRDDNGERFESANEVRLPVGQPVEITLTSNDVIHSFWVPKLAGKLDMIPGRSNVLTLSADRSGVSRGQCAEYCGGAHALMAFNVVALPSDEYAAWRKRESGPAAPPDSQIARRGMEIFMSHGCGGCHAIRGTAAAGTIAPDLTHIGSRVSLGAATLKSNPETIARWIKDNQHIKPGNLMPPYRIFDDAELTALATYLGGLR